MVSTDSLLIRMADGSIMAFAAAPLFITSAMNMRCLVIGISAVLPDIAVYCSSDSVFGFSAFSAPPRIIFPAILPGSCGIIVHLT